jgi:hypothetical protein
MASLMSTRSGYAPTLARSTNPNRSETGLTCHPSTYRSWGGVGYAGPEPSHQNAHLTSQ